MQDIDEFLASLLADKGITDIEPDVKEELINNLKEKFMDEVQRAAINSLNEEKLQEFDKKAEEDPSFTGEKVAEFLQDAGVNFAEIYADTALKFRSFYLGGLGE